VELKLRLKDFNLERGAFGEKRELERGKICRRRKQSIEFVEKVGQVAQERKFQWGGFSIRLWL